MASFEERIEEAKPRETAYYLALGVSPTANESQIKLGFLQKARELNPDKNYGDANDVRKFQELCEAYQVLKDCETRAGYNKFGASAVQRDKLKDSFEFLQSLFQSEPFEAYVGKISAVSQVLEEHQKNTPAQHASRVNEITEEFVRGSKETLSETLSRRLEVFVEGREEEFLQWARAEAERLPRASFGEAMLQWIGQLYMSHAQKKLGKAEKVKQAYAWINEKVMSQAKSLLKEPKADKSKKNTEDEEAMMVGYPNDWAIKKGVMEKVISEVCDAVFSSKTGREKRAKGLKKLGDIFEGAKEKYARTSLPGGVGGNEGASSST